MKYTIALLLTLGITTAHAEAVMQKVCHDDVKTKKEVCKVIKTHKKVEGTVVPDAPAKKSKKK